MTLSRFLLLCVCVCVLFLVTFLCVPRWSLFYFVPLSPPFFCQRTKLISSSPVTAMYLFIFFFLQWRYIFLPFAGVVLSQDLLLHPSNATLSTNKTWVLRRKEKKKKSKLPFSLSQGDTLAPCYFITQNCVYRSHTYASNKSQKKNELNIWNRLIYSHYHFAYPLGGHHWNCQ